MHNGEGCWTCVGRDGCPLPTIRLENFRDGLEDLAYAKLLEERLRQRQSEDEWTHAAKRLLSVPETVAKSLTDYSDDPRSVYVWRDAMADLLEINEGQGVETLVIADRSKEASCAIVVSSVVSPSLKYAAEGLCDFMEKATDARLPIMTNAKPLSPKAILVGNAK